MIDLYALTSPNVVKIFIALEELALPYKVITVDVWKSEQFTPEFTKLNPNRKIPVIVDHDGPGGKPITVFESGAILLYLADKTGKLVPKDKRAYFEMMQWLMIQLTTQGPMSGQRVHFRRFAPAGNDYSVTRYGTEVHRLYDLFEQRLAAHPYVGGAEYSIADIASFPWLRNHVLLDINIDDRPNVKRYIETIGARPAVKQALAKAGTITSARDTATDDAKDRFFQRGKYARA
jgi:GSH-dependent disulfide-bond oxidoreductase